MNPVSPQDEAGFLRLVHDLLQQTGEPAESRRSDRQPFPTSQLIAPFRGVGWPGPDEFESVRCFDLSTTGFSFLRSQPYPERQLVVALGSPTHRVHLTAEVVHERPLVLVGCRFTGRVER